MREERGSLERGKEGRGREGKISRMVISRPWQHSHKPNPSFVVPGFVVTPCPPFLGLGHGGSWAKTALLGLSDIQKDFGCGRVNSII